MLPQMFRTAVTIIFASLVGVAVAGPKIAVVRVADIHRALASTKDQAEAIKAEREAIGRDARLRAYQSVLKELDQISNKLKLALADTANPENSIRDNLKRDYSLKLQEATTIYREYEAFRSDRLREINAKMVAQMEESLALIHSKAAEIGKKKGVDWLLDSSGQSNTGVPFILYAKNPLDLTSDVLSALGHTATETTSDISR
jgi:outer membrane protein